MIERILLNAEKFRRQIAELKEKAPLFPHIHIENTEDGCLWATCMVKFEFEGEHYLRHHVESMIPSDHYATTDLHRRIVDQCQMTIKLGKPVMNFDVKVKK